MAHASIMPPMLRLRRSAQSASNAMAADWAVVYTESSVMAYIFAGAMYDLTTMALLDTIDVRVRKVIVSGGAWVVHDQTQYNDAQPVGHLAVNIGPIADVFGVEISMRQTAGTLRTIPCEFFDAMRLGLE